jgi:hypothetical protein
MDVAALEVIGAQRVVEVSVLAAHAPRDGPDVSPQRGRARPRHDERRDDGERADEVRHPRERSATSHGW